MNFQIYGFNSDLYDQMLRDMRAAEERIFLEVFIFRDDALGTEVRDILTQKAREGLEVKLLLDSFGSFPVPDGFFSDFIRFGGEIRYFHRLTFFPWLLDKINHRDHQKILVTDRKTAFASSANIEEDSIGWRELTIRVQEPQEVQALALLFEENFLIANKMRFEQKKIAKVIQTPFFEIIRDIPSRKVALVRNRTLDLIRKAQKEIRIENLYICTEKNIFQELSRAAGRGVDVKIVIPQQNEIPAMDILNKKYAARAFSRGIDVRLYQPGYLHSKLMIVDREVCMLGSANLDYRSLFLQFELMLVSRHPELVETVIHHFQKSYADSRAFSGRDWKKRSGMRKVVERLLFPVEQFL